MKDALHDTEVPKMMQPGRKRCVPGHTIRMTITLALLLVAAPSLAQDRPTRDTALDGFLAQIEGSFRASDPGGIGNLLSAQEKTIIVLPELYSSSGVFGPSQARFILQKIFSGYETVLFRIESKNGAPSQADLIQVGCRWDLRPRRATEPLHRTLFLRLRWEGERWVVSELRSGGTGAKRHR